MEGFGERLRLRAQELALSDTDVAKRLGMSQSRYANYVNNTREPDLATLARICLTLGITPDQALGFAAAPSTDDEAGRLRQRIQAAAAVMDTEVLKTALRVLEALIAPGDSKDTG